MPGQNPVVFPGYRPGVRVGPIREEGLLEGLGVKEVLLHEVVVALRISWLEAHVLVQVDRASLAEVQVTLRNQLVQLQRCAPGRQAHHVELVALGQVSHYFKGLGAGRSGRLFFNDIQPEIP